MDSPCDGGCSWADDTWTVCSRCATAVVIAQTFIGALVSGHVDIAVLPPGVGGWDQIPPAGQRAIVAVCRAMADRWTTAAVDTLSESGVDAVFAAQELDGIAGFLATSAPQEIRDGESILEMVVRLLGPHLQRPIVVTG